jgi:small subunit ribosomal protein S9
MPRVKKITEEKPLAAEAGSTPVVSKEKIKTAKVANASEEKVEEAASKTAPVPKTGYFFAVGRRKTATAKARLHLGDKDVLVGDKKLNKGDVYVNSMPIETYFKDPFARSLYTEVFRTTNTSNRFITTVMVEGSGPSGQAGAVVLAIARALCIIDPKFRPILRKKGFMTRDPRMKERKKPGLMGARKQKSSPKR